MTQGGQGDPLSNIDGAPADEGQQFTPLATYTNKHLRSLEYCPECTTWERELEHAEQKYNRGEGWIS